MGRPLKKIVADNLRRFMAESADCKTQEALEERSGVGQSTISRILKEQAATNIEALENIARALRRQPYELFVDGDEVMAEIVRRYLKRA